MKVVQNDHGERNHLRWKEDRRFMLLLESFVSLAEEGRSEINSSKVLNSQRQLSSPL